MKVRPAAVAGSFYPSDPSDLEAALVLAFASSRAADVARPKALIAPHAGYIYSGPVAASAYRTVEGVAAIRRVVLLGPSHFVPTWGVEASTADSFETPLGSIPLDTDARALAVSSEVVRLGDLSHAREHSLEVQLPFLQKVLSDGFSLLPLTVGQTEPEEVAAALDVLWGGPETLVVVSTDLSHYLDYETANERDRRTTEAILKLDETAIDDYDACGCRALRGLLVAARARGLEITLLDLRNSGDTAGDRDRVVGYGAFALS